MWLQPERKTKRIDSPCLPEARVRQPPTPLFAAPGTLQDCKVHVQVAQYDILPSPMSPMANRLGLRRTGRDKRDRVPTAA